MEMGFMVQVGKDVKRDKGRAEDKGRKVEMTGSRHDEPWSITARHSAASLHAPATPVA
jgi:hypothetical protein